MGGSSRRHERVRTPVALPQQLFPVEGDAGFQPRAFVFQFSEPLLIDAHAVGSPGDDVLTILQHEADGQQPAVIVNEGAEVGEAFPVEATVSHLKQGDRKSTRLNSSHVAISYAVFCLKKKMSANRHS